MAADAVGPMLPVPGIYGPEELRGISPTEIKTSAFFLENSLQVSDHIPGCGISLRN